LFNKTFLLKKKKKDRTFIFFGFRHQFNLVRESILAPSGFSPLPIKIFVYEIFYLDSKQKTLIDFKGLAETLYNESGVQNIRLEAQTHNQIQICF
jgi:hypothetical protein